jgi:hypothetical protein
MKTPKKESGRHWLSNKKPRENKLKDLFKEGNLESIGRNLNRVIN